MKKEFAFDKRFIFYIILGSMFSLVGALGIVALIPEFMWEVLLIAVVLLGYGLYCCAPNCTDTTKKHPLW